MKVHDLVEKYLTLSEEKREKQEAAVQRAEKYEQEAARIMERAKSLAEKKSQEAERIREELRKDVTVSWVDNVIKPIADALSYETGLLNKVSGPCGICCQVVITLYEDPELPLFRQDHKTLVLQPDFHEGGLTILYETGEKKERFAKGSLGELNGMNNVTAPLPDSVEDILKIMQNVPSLRKAIGLEDGD